MRNLAIIASTVLLLVAARPDRLDAADDDKYMHASRPLRTQRSVKFSPEEEGAEYWINTAQNILKGHLQRLPNTNQAKNVIMFLGDGMSVPTIAAARVYMGQQEGYPGEEEHLFFEDFPYVGLSKTYCVDSQVADSACTATAYLGGVKTNTATIGVTAAVKEKDCQAMRNITNHVTSLMDWAQAGGKATGIVTTARVTHASPAGAYANVAERNWECDADVQSDGQDPKLCTDIAMQLVTESPGKDFKVILGGGREKFRPKGTVDEEGQKAKRLDGEDLIKAWEDDKAARGASSAYVWNRDQLLAVNTSSNDYLLGLFEGGHMLYHLEADEKTEPTLAEMTTAAINTLKKNGKGFALFVEGGKIDHAHHASQARRALDETVQMADAVRVATQLTSEEDTLIVVTADHAHTMTMSGYPDRGSDVLGVGGRSNVDKLPYSTLSYSNGPGYKQPEQDGSRHDISKDDLTNVEYEYPALVPLSSETHGGDDVAVFAQGPWAHLLTGLYEQNYIPHVMAYAACIGQGLTACSNDS